MGFLSVGVCFSVCDSFLLFPLPLFANLRHGGRKLESFSTHLGLPVREACMGQHRDLRDDGFYY